MGPHGSEVEGSHVDGAVGVDIAAEATEEEDDVAVAEVGGGVHGSTALTNLAGEGVGAGPVVWVGPELEEELDRASLVASDSIEERSISSQRHAIDLSSILLDQHMDHLQVAREGSMMERSHEEIGCVDTVKESSIPYRSRHPLHVSCPHREEEVKVEVRYPLDLVVSRVKHIKKSLRPTLRDRVRIFPVAIQVVHVDRSVD
mmetsp:Transcript_24035/g.78204  ORF Transcript_24035/g.78204 Transcript_24035/m.78204 type:complete len:202 (-) Transcript_24035:620-1225(-)